MSCDKVELVRLVEFEDEIVKYTEVDFGNVDDEEDTDDGLNIFPPVTDRPPTQEEIQRSQDLDVSPTNIIFEDSTAAPPVITPPTTCSAVPVPPPDNFQLSPNYTLGQLSTQTALSHYKVVAQHSLTIPDIVCNLQAVAENILEILGAQYGVNKIMITSGFRPGSSTSQHERGQAVDIQFPKFDNQQIFDVATWMRDGMSFDQLILEYGGNRPWIHCSFNRAGNRPAGAPNKFGTRMAAGNYVWGKLIYAT
jgi:hypothetical protein